MLPNQQGVACQSPPLERTNHSRNGKATERQIDGRGNTYLLERIWIDGKDTKGINEIGFPNISKEGFFCETLRYATILYGNAAKHVR